MWISYYRRPSGYCSRQRTTKSPGSRDGRARQRQRHSTSLWRQIAHAFDLDGPGPRFLQDLDDLDEAKANIPEMLLIEAPGAETRRRNTTLLVKPDRVARLSRAAAAMALFTLQCYAPVGGQGNRTSVRGGGPLTTLVLPGTDPRTLWHLIWANTPAGGPPDTVELPLVFPWLAPTRTADRFRTTTPQQAHPLQAFWGMPRRIRPEFADNPDGLQCDLTGIVDPVIVTGRRQKKHGIDYDNWNHPLSPERKVKDSGWAPRPARVGIGYRDWAAIALPEADDARPARCVATWRERSCNISVNDSRLLASGYHVNKAKVIGFVESEMPLPGVNRETAASTAQVARRLVTASETAASALRSAVQYARFDGAASDTAPLAAIYEAFWAATSNRFYELALSVRGDWETALQERASKWRDALRKTGLQLFDEAAPLDTSAASCDPIRIVKARRNLIFTLSGYGSAGRKLFKALLLPSPKQNGEQR